MLYTLVLFITVMLPNGEIQTSRITAECPTRHACETVLKLEMARTDAIVTGICLSGKLPEVKQ